MSGTNKNSELEGLDETNPFFPYRDTNQYSEPQPAHLSPNSTRIATAPRIEND